MSASGGRSWLSITQVKRLTGLSDETIRKYCLAKVHFPSARLVNDRWEVPEDEVRAAKIIDRSLVVARAEITEQRLAQLERLEKLTSSPEGKFSLDQEVYIHSVKNLDDLSTAPPFQERGERGDLAGSRDLDAPEDATVVAAPADTTATPQQPGQPASVASQPEKHTEILLVRPGVAFGEDFLAYMTEHRDPTRLPDEFFGGEYAPEFIPPVGIEYHVALGPAGETDVNGFHTHTIVREYALWTYDGELAREEEGTFRIEGLYERGAIPDEYAEASLNYTSLRRAWNLRAVEARARLGERARTVRATFLPDLVWRPNVLRWIRRYQEERLHPSEFPDSVKVGLVDVPFIPIYNMFFFQSTGEVRTYVGSGQEYTVIGTTLGLSDEFGVVDQSPLEPLPFQLQWLGRHAPGELRPQDAAENAEYKAWKDAWEDMQREGRRLKERRNGE